MTSEPGERARRLMMAAIDAEITERERAELERLLAGDPELAAEWQRMTRVKEVTDGMALRKPPDEAWDGYRKSVYNRVERGLGWILLSVGTIALLGYGAWRWIEALLASTALPAWVKFAIGAVALGLVILFVSVIRERVFRQRREPYEEVQR